MIKVLIVEDNELNRDMLSRRLLKRGFDIVLAEDGEEGILSCEQEQPNIVLMDLSLPIIDGWEAIKELKKKDSTKQIPIIALTAHAMRGDKEKALEAGADDYDTKPVVLARLLEKIESLVKA